LDVLGNDASCEKERGEEECCGLHVDGYGYEPVEIFAENLEV
jgi:hypothetical protein